MQPKTHRLVALTPIRQRNIVDAQSFSQNTRNQQMIIARPQAGHCNCRQYTITCDLHGQAAAMYRVVLVVQCSVGSLRAVLGLQLQANAQRGRMALTTLALRRAQSSLSADDPGSAVK